MNKLSTQQRNYRVFLIGPMGAGKSTLGKRLAHVEGEEGFRDREASLLEELTTRDNLVLATGGGIVLREQNRSILRERGFVVYLYAPLDRLLERTSKDTSRPLLQTENPRARLEEILHMRNSLYEQTADLSIDTDKLSIAQIIQHIKGQLPWGH